MPTSAVPLWVCSVINECRNHIINKINPTSHITSSSFTIYWLNDNLLQFDLVPCSAHASNWKASSSSHKCPFVVQASRSTRRFATCGTFPFWQGPSPSLPSLPCPLWLPLMLFNYACCAALMKFYSFSSKFYPRPLPLCGPVGLINRQCWQGNVSQKLLLFDVTGRPDPQRTLHLSLFPALSLLACGKDASCIWLRWLRHEACNIWVLSNTLVAPFLCIVFCRHWRRLATLAKEANKLFPRIC